MNLAVLCFLGNNHDLVLRKYVEWFVSGYEIGLTNHHVAFMHEQTILDYPMAIDVDYVHIVFAERFHNSMEVKLLNMIHSNVFPVDVKFSFTCIKGGIKSTQLCSGDLEKKFYMQLGELFNGCSYWSIGEDWLKGNQGLIKWIQNRKLCQRIENEGLNFGKSYVLNSEPKPEMNQGRPHNRSVYEMQTDI